MASSKNLMSDIFIFLLGGLRENSVLYIYTSSSSPKSSGVTSTINADTNAVHAIIIPIITTMPSVINSPVNIYFSRYLGS